MIGKIIMKNKNQHIATQPPLSYPETRSAPSASQTATNELVASMNGTKLDNDNNESTKRRK